MVQTYFWSDLVLGPFFGPFTSTHEKKLYNYLYNLRETDLFLHTYTILAKKMHIISENDVNYNKIS